MMSWFESAAQKYGKHYYCIGLPDGGEVYALADRIEISDGCLSLLTEEGQVTIAFGVCTWRHVYAASGLDGSPVAAYSWAGELVEGARD